MKELCSAQEEEGAGEVRQSPLAMRIAGVELSQVNAILVEKDLNAVDQWNVSKNAIRTWLRRFLCQIQISSWTSMSVCFFEGHLPQNRWGSDDYEPYQEKKNQ
jgi:hypothetical protein